MGYNFRVTEVRHFYASDSTRKHIEVDLSNVGIAPFYKDWNVELAICDEGMDSIVERIDVETDIRAIEPSDSITLKATTNKPLDPLRGYQLALRILQPGADEDKTEAWKLNERNVYVVLANEIEVIDGIWDKKTNALRGGWNVLGKVDLPPAMPSQAAGKFFPFEGSFRPIARP